MLSKYCVSGYVIQQMTRCKCGFMLRIDPMPSHVFKLFEFTDAEQSAQASWAEDQDSIGESHSAWRIGTCCASLAQFEPALCPAVDTVNREPTGERHLRCQHQPVLKKLKYN